MKLYRAGLLDNVDTSLDNPWVIAFIVALAVIAILYGIHVIIDIHRIHKELRELERPKKKPGKKPQ